jgi:hypothetical protein
MEVGKTHIIYRHRDFYETAVGIKGLLDFSFIVLLFLILLLSIGLLFGFLSDFYPHSNWVLVNPVPIGVR